MATWSNTRPRLPSAPRAKSAQSATPQTEPAAAATATNHAFSGFHDGGIHSRPRKVGEPEVTLNGERHHDHPPSLRCDELEAMLIYSMSVSVDGFIADREGAFGWGAPSEELFRFPRALVGELGGYLLGRRLYETMLVWETDPAMRDSELRAAFADVWCALPKVVFSRTLESVQGN